MKITYWNARSINNKTICIHDYLASNHCDILCFTETWLSSNTEVGNPNQVVLAAALPAGFQFKHIPRNDGLRGGGVGIAFSEEANIKFNNIQLPKCDQYERMQSQIYSGTNSIIIVLVYRPQPNKKNGLKLKLFWPQWVKLLSSLVSLKGEFIILGDLNFHLDKLNNRSTQKFNNILSEFDLYQHVHEPTHIHGHTLDVTITRTDSKIISNLKVSDLCFINDSGDEIKDHLAIKLTVKAEKRNVPQKQIHCRNWKNIDQNSFQRDLNARMANIPDETNPGSLTQWYNKNLIEIADSHAPLRQRIVRQRNNPWYNNNINMLKQTKRKLERKWLKTKLTVHHQNYKKHCSDMYKRIRRERILYNKTKIEEANQDYKKISSLTNHLLGRSNSNKYPKLIPRIELPNTFANFFTEKIDNIQKEIMTSIQEIPAPQEMLNDGMEISPLVTFDLCNNEEISQILSSVPNKQCLLDPVPTWFLKKNLPLFIPPIVSIVNSSLSSGTLPSELKTALVRPILKDQNLDPELLKNYRPVSNLPVLAKIIEKVVYKRLNSHIQANNLLDCNQSAYRKNHSTETALLAMQSDILCYLDKGLTVAVVILDLSAAFDTVSHKKLIDCFRDKYNISNLALEWLASYLTGRKQKVIIDSNISELFDLEFGFPQGAVLAGLFYNMFSAPLGEIARKYPINHKGFADDNSWYAAFVSKNKDEVLNQLKGCLLESKAWMIHNNFQVNDGKSKIMYFTPQKQLDSSLLTFTLGPTVLKPEKAVKSLGVYLDQCMTMEDQINSVTKSVYFNIKNVSKIRKYLTLNSAKTLVQALIISRLDYCNALLGNIPLRLTRKLQRAQNAAARMLLKKGRRSRMTPALKQLHWLPVSFRIKFKILLLTYKCLKGLAPLYLRQLIKPYVASRSLRSNNNLQGTLTVSRFRKRKFGGRAFSNVSALLWNELPVDIRESESVSVFKSKLKTHFFTIHFINNQ